MGSLGIDFSARVKRGTPVPTFFTAAPGQTRNGSLFWVVFFP
jgi:hypothetical protein